jgi:small subunit ribosomal protein S6
VAETTKLYELTVLLHPDLEIDLDKTLKKVEGIIDENGGKIAKKDVLGKQKMAYQIKHQDFAVYVYYEVNLPLDSSSKLQSVLNITGEVIRYLLVAKDLKAPEKESSDKKEGE